MGALLDRSLAQYFTTSPFTLAAAHTISIWVRNDLNAANQTVLENKFTGFSYQRFEVDSLVPRARQRNGFPAESVASGPVVPFNAWTHLLFELTDANTRVVYTDGVAGLGVGSADLSSFQGTQLSLGARVSGVNPFSGFLAEIGIWPQLLSAATKAALFAGARPNSTPEPVQFYTSLESNAAVQVGGLVLDEQNGPIDVLPSEHPVMFDMATATALNFDRPPAGVARGVMRGMQR